MSLCDYVRVLRVRVLRVKVLCVRVLVICGVYNIACFVCGHFGGC